MKRITLFVLLLAVLIPVATQAQGLFDNFWHPKPPIIPRGMMMTPMEAPITATAWEVKPSIAIGLMSLSPSNVSGQPWVTGVISGAGPGLCLANTTQDLETGVNYINYSFTGSLIFGGSFNQAPVVGTSAAISANFFNNLISVGYKYDFYSPDNRKPWAIMVGTNIMPFLN